MKASTGSVGHLFESLGSRTIVVVRFNPDAYVNGLGRKHPSIFTVPRAGGNPMANEFFKPALERLAANFQQHIMAAEHNEVPVKEWSIPASLA